MKNSIKIITVITVIIFVGFLIFRLTHLVREAKTEQFITASLSPSPTPSIKTFQFDKSTDLGTELEKVDPKVLDSDFE